ncbi:DEAD/DEAH box helicase [Paenibacillus thailandensis]|uniref:DEAD/DEAH box helicase n=1 Tax=Paenibacillus thailandensis TaxID=393250 RepID=UPI00362AE497
MRAFIGAGAHPPVIDGYWQEGAQGGAVVLFETGRPEAAVRLRQALFAWHKPSWYGEDIEETVIAGRNVLMVPPLLAVDYMAAPKPVRLLRPEWTGRAARLMELARLIRLALLNGWFIPDWQRWSEQHRAWKAAFPETETELTRKWEETVRLAAEEGSPGAERWLSEAVEAVIAQSGEAREAWEQIGRTQGESVVSHKSADEEDWLIAIGVRKDRLPFRAALQLVEPEGERGWRLRPALQDRDGGSWLPLRRDGAEWKAESADSPIPADWLPLVPGKLEKEQSKWLSVMPDWEDRNASGFLRSELTDNEAWLFLEQYSLRLLEAGSPVLLPGWWEAVRSRRLRLKAKMKSSVGSAAEPMFGLNQIVQFDWKLAIGNVDLSEAEFMRLAAENRRLANIGGEWVHLDPHDIEQIKQWMKRVGKKKGLSFRDVLEMHLHGGALLEEDGDEAAALRAEVELNEHLSAWLEQLQHITEIPLIGQTAGLRGELRPYQHQGVSWMAFLRRFGLGGVLADDMGLGKTIQFIAYLVYVNEREKENSRGPSLLICPTSVIGNWQKELERFAPGLRVYVHYGPKRDKGEALRDAAAEADLVITSYSLAQLDEEDLREIEWNALCLDEAQNIKNVYTKQSAAIRSFNAFHRLALTGTPMENRLTELWSIYDFINPGYLGSLHEFRRAVVAPIEKTRDEELIKSLQRWVRPFMLRRVKKDPAIQLSLPDKYESKTYISLTAEQGAIYENIVSELLDKLDTLGPMQRRGLILASLTRLKQLCDHPALLTAKEEGPSDWDTERSGKLSRLLEMVEEVAAEGERCLIFTQFVEMGNRIQKLLKEKLGVQVPYLHGGVPKAQRDEMIAGFQDERSDSVAFVLSLKAGGNGAQFDRGKPCVPL